MSIGIRHIALPLVGVAATVLAAWLVLAASVTSRFTVPATPWPARTPSDWPVPQTGAIVVGRGVRIHTISWTDDPSDNAFNAVPGTPKALDTSLIECGWPWPALSSTQWSITPWSTQVPTSFPTKPRVWGDQSPVASGIDGSLRRATTADAARLAGIPPRLCVLHGDGRGSRAGPFPVPLGLSNALRLVHNVRVPGGRASPLR
jgi:hypothetical protein